MRIVPLFAVASAALVVLCGCEMVVRDPMAIQRAGSSLVVTICGSILASDVLIHERGPEPDDDWTTYFEFEGSVRITSDVPITTDNGAQALGPEETKSDPPMTSGDVISILVADNVDPVDSFSNEFIVPEAGLPADAWLQWDGTMTDEPCNYRPES